MTITKLQGGLGNQMFQYAMAFSCSERVYIDFSFLQKNNKTNDTFTKRDFELSLFPNLKYKEFTEFYRNILFSNQRRYYYFRKLFSIKPNVVKQKENELVEFKKNKFLYLDGYFQSEKYFIKNRKELLHIFEFPALDQENQALKEQILQHPNSVSLHIRRGDYLKDEIKKYHGTLEQEYYDKAIETIKEKYSNAHFFVFCDDENFAIEQYSGLENFTIVKGNSENAWKDMALMSYCKHHIIANSSFSWWGAWLSTYKDSINIAPKKWFNPELANFNIDDFVPSHWIKI